MTGGTLPYWWKLWISESNCCFYVCDIFRGMHSNCTAPIQHLEAFQMPCLYDGQPLQRHVLNFILNRSKRFVFTVTAKHSEVTNESPSLFVVVIEDPDFTLSLNLARYYALMCSHMSRKEHQCPFPASRIFRRRLRMNLFLSSFFSVSFLSFLLCV